MKYDLLQLQKAHADLHKDSTTAGKVDRKINAFESREFKRRLKSDIRDKIVKLKRNLDLSVIAWLHQLSRVGNIQFRSGG